MHVLITGASGYLGRALTRLVLANGHRVTAMVRQVTPGLPPQASYWVVPDICVLPADASERMRGVDCIVHCAGRAHVLQETAGDPIDAFRRVNVRATLELAEQAAAANVARFVFVSSIGVNGSSSAAGPFRYDDAPRPSTPYTVSKLEAEQALDGLCTRTPLQVLHVRPPMVYGPDAPGNFALLRKAVASGMPLPLGALHQPRSFVSLDNMTDLLLHLVTWRGRSSGTYLVSDGQDMGTSEFVRKMAGAMGRRCWLVPVPERLLVTVAGLLGRAAQVRKMAAPLALDIAHTREQLGWAPRWTVEQSLLRAFTPVDNSGLPTSGKSNP